MKTPQTNDSLAKAIAYLGAVEVAPGRFAYYDLDGLKRWMTVSADTLDLINTEGSVQSAMTWLAMRDYAQVMPAWWSPEQRFAWALDRKTGNKREAFDGTQDEGIKALSRLACHITNGLPRGRKRITADLTTGAEVPACD